MTWLTWALLVGLATPPTAPVRLGEGLDRVGAFEPALDPSLQPPIPPAREGARRLLLVGVSLIAAGAAGWWITPGCATRAADARCVDARGTRNLFPALIVLGLGATATSAWWLRRDLPER